jgi:hypothetical protein
VLFLRLFVLGLDLSAVEFLMSTHFLDLGVRGASWFVSMHLYLHQLVFSVCTVGAGPGH